MVDEGGDYFIRGGEYLIAKYSPRGEDFISNLHPGVKNQGGEN